MKYIILFLTLLILTTESSMSGEFEYKKENLGPGVNSVYNDFFPVISPDGKTLFFYRSNHPENTGGKNDGDIWFSELNSNGVWGKALNIGPPLNNERKNFVCSVSPDGNTLLLGKVYNRDGSTEKGVSISYRTNDGWSFPEQQHIERFYNLNDYFGEFFLTNDGKTLLMAIQRRQTFGRLDIYVSFLKESNSWTRPKNLGPVINSRGNEFSPFLASDGITLYFSSAGHKGYGDADIFMSRRLDDTWQNWSPVINLGPSINTVKSDANFRIDAFGEYAYFASREGAIGESDIFRIKLKDSLKPKKVAIISGKVSETTDGKPLSALVKYELLPSGKEVGIARSNPKTGEYKIILPVGALYGFRADIMGYVSMNDNLDLTGDDPPKEIKKDLLLAPVKDGEKIRLNNIFFDFDEANLKPASYPELNRLAELLTNHKSVRILISGYTDNKGSDEYNMELSAQRAKSVLDYLTESKIDKERLEYTGHGSANPLMSNDTEEGRKMNRRVEITILSRK